MYEVAERARLRQTRKEDGREAAPERLTGMAHEDRETGPFMVRDLSWVLARYPDTKIFPPNAPTTPESARAQHGRKREGVSATGWSARAPVKGVSYRALIAGRGDDEIGSDS